MMEVGKQIKLGGEYYNIESEVKKNGTHSDIYRITDSTGKEYILKKFKDQKRCNAWLPYRSKKNHYGRTREVHPTVFAEIRSMSFEFEFLVKHFSAQKYRYEKNGDPTWCWTLVQEFVDGVSIGDFATSNVNNNPKKLETIFGMLGMALGNWHAKNFAHGDPHLFNGIINFNGGDPVNVTLVDYSQIHHPSFEYCKKCGCFSDENKRFKEDLENNGVMGKGFLKEIIKFENTVGINNKIFQNSFRRGYLKKAPSKLIDNLVIL